MRNWAAGMKFEVQKRRDRSGHDVQAVVGVGDLGAITILLEVGDEALCSLLS